MLNLTAPQRTKPHSASSLPTCHQVRNPAEKSELAFLQTSKFRYVSACQCSCVLNKQICNLTYITHAQLCIFFLSAEDRKKNGRAP